MFAARRVLGASSLAARQLSSSSGRLATTPRVPYKPTVVAPKTVARAATSTAGRGNPDTETLPSTAKEVDIERNVENARDETTGQFVGETLPEAPGDATTDWSTSYQGLSVQPFSKETAEILMAPIDPMDVEIKPDGLLYLPEIKYRRILNKAFGPGGWGLAPRSGINVSPKTVSREFALVCLGRLVAIARGEQEYFDPEGVATATEAAKSNALMRCCKDLGIASELWDPRFIREFKAKHCVEVFVEHATNKNKKKLWRRKDQPKFDYPWKENTSTFAR